MRRLGRTGHKDGNQDAIVLALRKFGASVTVTSGHGFGMPDLLVGYMGQTFLFEVKNKEGRGVKLTDNEQHFVANWKGRPVKIIENPEEAINYLIAETA